MGAATSGVYDAPSDGDAARADVAFASLYRAHAAFTWSCLRRLGVPSAAVDDAMQELWVTAHRRLDTLRSDAVAKAWLLGIARRIASHHRRAEQRHRRRVDAFGEHAPRSTEPERASSMIVESILASLDERVREAFVLSELEGWSAAEISAATGANTNTIYWRVRTAKHQLQARLAEGDLEARVIALREDTKPSRKSIAHAWVMLVPELGKPIATTGVLGWWAAAKVAVIGATTTVAVATGVDMARTGTRDAAVPSVVAHADAPRESSPAPAADRSAVAAVLPSPEVPSAAIASTSSPVRAFRPASRPTVRTDAAEATDAARVTEATVAPPPSPALDVAAEEAALLAAIKADLAAGRRAQARAGLERHRDRFPASGLADVRAAISIELDCAAGDLAKARAELSSWRERLGVAKAARLDAICGAKDPR
jgi:RNA polymerase sigma-70 factor (ECF subfamily)